MATRDKILKKLRSKSFPASDGILPISDSQYFKDYPENEKNALIKLFAERFEKLRGEFFLVHSLKEAGIKLLELLASVEKGKALTDGSQLFRKICTKTPELIEAFVTEAALSSPSPEMSRYVAGVTSADFLIARTGSVVLRCTDTGGRRASVLPPLHIVLATADQFVPSLDSVFQNEQFNAGNWSYGTIITGPSRTADIEKILVLGAHGPKRMAVVLVD